MGAKNKNPQPTTGAGRDGGAFAFISKGWREARETATADLSLMRARADRELDHVRRRIEPKITELRRHCSSTALLEGWPPRAGASLRVDLAAIRNAVVADGRGGGEWPWKGGSGKGRAEWGVVTFVRSGLKECELAATIRSGLRELERRSLASEVLGGFRGRGEFLEKLKLSLVHSTIAFNIEIDDVLLHAIGFFY
jgi:digalactosyldiacylglycerol synthase